MNDRDEIVLLTSASSEIEANMWNLMLQDAGIKALIRPGGPGAGAWASAATFDHHIYVRADQLERAQDVLGGALNDQASLPRARTTAPRTNPRQR